MADQFCTIDDVQNQLTSNSSWTDRDDAITCFIEQATQSIKNYTRRDWVKKSRTQLFHTIDVDNLLYNTNEIIRWYPNEIPLSDTPAPVVKFSSSGDFANIDPLDTSKYFVDYDKNQIGIYTSQMVFAPRSIQIVYTAGFSKGNDKELPDLVAVSTDLRMACAVQAATLFRKALDHDAGLTEKNSKRGKVVYNVLPTGLVPEAQAQIKHLVRTLTGSI